MVHGEGGDAVEAFLDDDRGLGEVQFLEFQGEAKDGSGDGEEELDGLFGAFGGEDGDGLGAAGEVQGGEESGEAEEVVAVEMGDEDHLDALDFLMVFAELGLGVLAAVDEDAVAADGDEL